MQKFLFSSVSGDYARRQAWPAIRNTAKSRTDGEDLPISTVLLLLATVCLSGSISILAIAALQDLLA